MIKALFKNNFFMIFAIAFAIPVIVIFFIMVNTIVEYNEIANNYIETDAYLIEDSFYSSTTINGEPYYSIEYYFYDEDLNKHYGKTSETFTRYDLEKMIDEEVIKIKYNPETFKSMESSYKWNKDSGNNFLWIFMTIFGIADIVFWCIVIKTAKHNVVLLKVEKNGKEYSATVTGISSNLVVNGVRKYKVHYSWLGDNGETFKGSSTSKYTYNQASSLEKIRSIEIKAIGKNSIILTVPDLCYDEHYGVGQDDYYVKEGERTCDYCRHKISETDEYCSNCGARVNIYK